MDRDILNSIRLFKPFKNQQQKNPPHSPIEKEKKGKRTCFSPRWRERERETKE